jgi:hypothetical protein
VGIAALRRAAGARAAPGLVPELARLRFDLGRALWSVGARSDARDLIESARRGIEASGGRPVALARELDAWRGANGSAGI